MLSPRFLALSVIWIGLTTNLLAQAEPPHEPDSIRWNRILDWALQNDQGTEFSQELFKESLRFSSKTMESWVAAVRELSQKNTNDQDWQNLWASLDQDKVEKLPTLLMPQMGTMGNNKRFPGTYFLENVPRSILFRSERLGQSWNEILGLGKTLGADAVTYDGVKGSFVYQSVSLRNSVANLAQAIVFGDGRVFEIFLGLSKSNQQRFIERLNVGAEQHQIRPVELLAWEIRDIILRELSTRNDEAELIKSINSTALGQMIQNSLLGRLSFEPAADLESLMSFSATGGPVATYLLLCAPGEMRVFEDGRTTWHSRGSTAAPATRSRRGDVRRGNGPVEAHLPA